MAWTVLAPRVTEDGLGLLHLGLRPRVPPLPHLLLCLLLLLPSPLGQGTGRPGNVLRGCSAPWHRLDLEAHIHVVKTDSVFSSRGMHLGDSAGTPHPSSVKWLEAPVLWAFCASVEWGPADHLAEVMGPGESAGRAFLGAVACDQGVSVVTDFLWALGRPLPRSLAVPSCTRIPSPVQLRVMWS